jgi:predicted RNase H-like HicB family nuclease
MKRRILMKLVYPACLIPFENENDGFCVEFPDLKGCITQGRNMAEAIEMAVDAASGWVLDEMEDGNEPPVATPNYKPDTPDCLVSLVVLDMDSYAEKYGKKAVRKNLTIPAWLATAADKKQLNYSAVLQDALKEQLEIAM